ncbi:MAG: penicillin-binding protein 2 [Armatimonadetes bacterium]|nr:penicillin-binding protein 2 [Armatimonadota bacterium]
MDTKLRLPNESREISQRVRAFRVCVSFAFFCLLARLWYLQVVKGKEYDTKAQGVRVRNIYLPAPRGILYDRNGKILVTSRTSYTVSIIPAYLKKSRATADLPSDGARPSAEETLQSLGAIVHMSPVEIETILKRGTFRSFDPVRIKQEVDLTTVTRILENGSRLPGVQVENDITRYYPRGRFAAHVLGYIGEISEEELKSVDRTKWRPGDVYGKFGSESMYNEYLHGLRGAEQIEVDASGRPARRLGERARIPGKSVMLSLDVEAQKAAEEGLIRSGRSGAVVAMDVHSGEVLALASKPDFDPNVFSQKITPAMWRQLSGDPRHPLVNRALGSKFPPGSTYKMVTSSAALELGATNPDFSVYCSGKYRLGRTFRCWKRAGHGVVNLYSALSKSCDVYFYTVGRKLGQERLGHISRGFGLGSRTGIDLPGEVRGTVPSDEWKRKRFHERWYPGDTINLSIGQGFLQVTPIQMACVAAAIANGGQLVRPHVLKKILSPEGEVIKTFDLQVKPVPVRSEALAEVRRGMRLAVLEGTARVLKMDYLAVAAKTGSAEDVHSPIPHAWIVSFAPYENAQIAVVVFLENAGHGGEQAGPIARRVYEALFKPAESTSETRVAMGNLSSPSPRIAESPPTNPLTSQD